MRFPRSLFHLILTAGFPPLAVPCVWAQIPPNSSTTATPVPGAGHEYLNGFAETVNPSTGSLSIRIPAIMPLGRGITLPFTFAYDSSGVNWLKAPTGAATIGFWQTTSSVISQAGWSNSAPVVSNSMISWTTSSTILAPGATTPVATPLAGTITCHALINFMFQDARGSRHNLNLSNFSDPTHSGPCGLNEGDWPAYFDGLVVGQGGEGPILAAIPTDSWYPSTPVTVTDGDGTVFSFLLHTNGTWLASSVVDRNGNTIAINPAYPAFSYTDTTNRLVLQDSGFAVSPENVTISGLGAPYTLVWTILATPTFTTPITTLSGTCSTSHNPWNTNSDHAVSTLTLPNGKSFTFGYDTLYGLVNKITYPTGGYVRYVWGMNTQAELAGSQNCTMLYGVPAVTDRYVSFDGT